MAAMAGVAYAEPMEEGGTTAPPAPAPAPMDILDVVEPSAQMKAKMRMVIKTPSEWLRLLCHDWSLENEAIVAGTDSRFLQYKSYLKGRLTSQLLCRLSMSSREGGHEVADPALAPLIDFWKILGVDEEFDRAHIVANIERFCSLYNIRGGTLDGLPPSPPPAIGNRALPDVHDPGIAAAAVAAPRAGVGIGTNRAMLLPVDPNTVAVTVPHTNKRQVVETKNRRIANPETVEQRRLKAELREREREAYGIRKAAEKAARLAAREERRHRKLAMRRQREEIAQQQKEAALRRAAELVQSDRVPVEITRWAIAAQAAANMAVAVATAPSAYALGFAAETPAIPTKKCRSSIVISTASDLDQIVTHANNLWAKYNSIAKEHNKKVNWIVVAKELGIHVKVREKYARMHARAQSRGFDFANWGYCRIKDYPQYFLDPLGPTPASVAATVEEPGKQAPEAIPQLQQLYLPSTVAVPLPQGEASMSDQALPTAVPIHHNLLTIVAKTPEVVGNSVIDVSNTAVFDVSAEVSGDETPKLGTSHPCDEVHNFGGTTAV